MKKAFKWIVFVFTTFLSAIVFNMFYEPLRIVAGGSSGIGILLKSLFFIDPSITILIISLVIVSIAFFFLPKEKILSSILASILLPFFIKITANIPNAFEIGITEPLMIAGIAGLINGFTTGIDSKNGFNSGGITLLSEVIHEKTYIPMVKISNTINTIIVITGVFVNKNVMNLIYALIVIFVARYVYDRVFLGISSNKAFYVITNEDKKVEDFLKKEGYGATLIQVKGAYSRKDDQLIMSVVPTIKYNYVKDTIKGIDKEAFMIVTDSYHVKGGV